MQLGIVGLGRMGGNIARRLTENGHECVVFDRDAHAVSALADGKSIAGSSGLDDLARRLTPPRAVWVMLPAGGPTDDTVAALGGLLSGDDVIIDGGNSFWQDDIRRAQALLAKGAEVWRRGSVISSWLLDLTAAALAEDEGLEHYTGYVEDSGEGRWTIHAAVNEAVPADVLSAALYARFRSREPESFAMRLLSAMRKGFGGHVEPKSGAAPAGGERHGST